MSDFVLVGARTTVRIGQELGRGGEGTVFAIEGRADLVAKLYSTPPDSRKTHKLIAMARAACPSLLKVAAWPLDVLRDQSGRTRGFVMPHANARRDIHELYSPKSRSETFVDADFRFIVHVAANVARAFAAVHEHGHVLGDVNHSNLLVGADGTVMFIDCDSFQFREGTQCFTSDVGVPLFTAPELHGQALRGLERTANHDSFGLAILLFHLLYMGRHPFAGRYLGQGEMGIERAIAEYRFAYGTDSSTRAMERPPGTVPLETMGPLVAGLFAKAFGGPTRGPQSRPDAPTWLHALERLAASLRACTSATWHQYPNTSTACPWCVVESTTGARLFGQRVAFVATGTVDIATLWGAISAVRGPGADPPLPSEGTGPLPLQVAVSWQKRVAKATRMVLSVALACTAVVGCSAAIEEAGVFAIVLGWGGFVIAGKVWPRPSDHEVAEANRVVAAARTEWEQAVVRWRREASRDAFDEKLRALQAAKAALADLPNERRRRVAQLDAAREGHQRQRYLDRFRIDRASIRGIGPSRTAMLASYGIETARDVERQKIMQIPGFKAALTAELVTWRQRHERNFRFNANEPVDPRDLALLDRELDVRRRECVAALQAGPATLLRITQEIDRARPGLLPVLERAWINLKNAEARRRDLE